MSIRLSADDRLDILDLYGRYNHLVDSGPPEAWADECFTPDAVFRRPDMPPVVGREALIRYKTRPLNQGRHWLSNIVIEPTETGAAGKAYLLVVRPTDAEGTVNSIVMTGRYDDRLAKGPTGWRFASRTVTFETPFDGLQQPFGAPALAQTGQ